MNDRLCHSCKHFDMGSDDGEGFLVWCEMLHWAMKGKDESSEFRAYIKTAVTCPDYEVVE